MTFSFSHRGISLLLLLLAGCTTVEDSDRQPVPATLLTTLPDNCGVGCPAGGSVQTIIRQAYTLNNNRDTRFAAWVAYRITGNSQASGRSRNWRRDPDLPAADTLAPAAYRNASAQLAVDRGHQAPLASLASATDWATLNYLSNITPQKAALNQGAWAQLEDRERALINTRNASAVWVVTGPLFETPTETLPAAPEVPIPSGYWKILYTGSSPQQGQYAAFLLEQNTPRHADFCDYQVTVAEIEQRTRPPLTFWPGLPDAVAHEIKQRKGTLAQALGCAAPGMAEPPAAERSSSYATG